MLNDFFDSNIVKSLSCLLFSYISCFILTKYFINFSNRSRLTQPIRKEGPKSHLQEKKNTPTMGGIPIIISVIISSLLFLDLSNPYLVSTLAVFLIFAIVGLIDDLTKVIGKNTRGLSGSIKLIIQFVVISYFFIHLGDLFYIYSSYYIYIPIFDSYIWLGLLIYLLLTNFVVVGAGNGSNLTDGLDGLVTIPLVLNLIALSILIYVGANPDLTKIWNRIDNRSMELIYFTICLIGALLAFLFFNLKPAKIFMGDVGSLSIGSVLGVLAIISKQEIIFFIISLLFVIESLSVIIQVASFKILKKRVLLMAPIHHHFEKKGWKEKKVVRIFWLAALCFNILGLVIFLAN